MELTNRQSKTFSLIQENTKLGRVTTQKEIYQNYPIENYKDGYLWHEDKTHDHCPTIWSDIEKINQNSHIEELVITKDNTYKIATNQDEALAYSKFYMNKALKSLKRYWNVIRKVNSNGQGQIDFDNLKTEFINTYGKEITKN